MATAGSADLGLYRRLLAELRPYWRHIAGILLIDLLGTVFTLLLPLPLKIAVDSVIGSQPLPGFVAALLPGAITPGVLLGISAGLLVVIAVLNRLQALGSSLLRVYTSEKLVLDFRARLFRHAQRLSISYHDAKGTSESTYRIQWDAAAVQYVAIDGVIPLITESVTLLLMIYIAVLLDWQLALVALAIAPVLFLLSGVYRRRLRRQSREAKKLESSTFSVLQEVLAALRVVKAFGQEDREQDRYVDRSKESMGARIRLAYQEGIYSLLVGLTTVAGTAAVLYIGVSHVLEGTLHMGELLLVIAYIAQLYEPLKTLGKKVASLQSHLASAERAYALLDETPDVSERPSAAPCVRARGAVAFRDVCFGYEKDRPVLSDISFAVAPGTRVGIVGTTGVGKTTLVSLLTRFYDPDGGQIELDGVDLRDYRLAELRNQFALVLQDPVLFSTSIAENIAYARPDAGEADIIAAARAANAHDFITSLPDGYETQVGERGMCLSGGERQRIGVARAFLRDAPILILDEPTSSVDVATEGVIMEAMERLMRGRTTFIIAHRLGTLENCELLLRVEKGQVTQEGRGARGEGRVINPLDTPHPSPLTPTSYASGVPTDA
jgi:ATP-binding cassette subfamily B protein